MTMYFYNKELDLAQPIPDFETLPDIETTTDNPIVTLPKVMEQFSFSCTVAMESLTVLRELFGIKTIGIPKRVVYLSKHGKPRTRKKNMNRILKEVWNESRNKQRRSGVLGNHYKCGD